MPDLLAALLEVCDFSVPVLSGSFLSVILVLYSLNTLALISLFSISVSSIVFVSFPVRKVRDWSYWHLATALGILE